MTTEHDRKRLADQSSAELALKAVAGPAYYPLVNRLSNCAGAAEAAGEDRVLRIVGVQLAQLGAGELFEQIYSLVIDGAEPGDGQRFLLREFHP